MDDFYSLLYVAYKFVFRELPWEKMIAQMRKNEPESITKSTFIVLRRNHRHEFLKQILESSKELKPLFKCLENWRLQMKQ